MDHKIAIDFGMTNSVVTHWNMETGSAEFISIPGISSDRSGDTHFLIPTLLYVEDGQSERILIGQSVKTRGLEHQDDQRLFRSFKRGITTGRSLDSRLIDDTLWTDMKAGQHFLCELISKIPYAHDEIEKLVITAPVGALDSYTNWLSKVLPAPVPDRTQIMDESTAAALGYNVTGPGAIVLIVDFGGGSLDVSLVRLPMDYSKTGKSLRQWLKGKWSPKEHNAYVIAKHGINLGGNDIDHWLLSEVLERSACTYQEIESEYATLVVACEQAKIELSTLEETSVTWHVKNGKEYFIPVTRPDLETLVTKHGFFSSLHQAVDHVLTAARRDGIYLEDVQYIFMVGGTSLVPSVQQTLQGIFRNSTVRVDKPFTAVAEGALAVAVGLDLDDRLVHSYGLRYLNLETGKHDYDEIFSSGSRYPTRKSVDICLSTAHSNQHTIEFVIGQISTGTTSLVKIQHVMNETASIAHADHTTQQIMLINSSSPLKVFLDPQILSNEVRLQASFTVDVQQRLRISLSNPNSQQVLLHDVIVTTLGTDSELMVNVEEPDITGYEPRIITSGDITRKRFSLRGLATRLNLLPPELASLSAITASLESPSTTDRTHAANMLGRRGDREARQIIQFVLKNGSGLARASVIHEVHRFSWFVAEPFIRQALTDSDPRVSESAVYALCKMRVYEAYQVLMDILPQQSDEMRLAAVWALNDGTDAASESLSRMWDLKDSILRQSAAPGIGAVPILAIALQAQAPHVRIATLEALGATQVLEAIAVVKGALNDPDFQVRYTAVLSLIELAGQECLPQLAESIERATGQARLPVVQGLFHASNLLLVNIESSPAVDRLIDVLEMALHDELVDVRIAVAMLLASIQHGRAVDVLNTHYNREQDREVKTRMVLAAESFGMDLKEQV